MKKTLLPLLITVLAPLSSLAVMIPGVDKNVIMDCYNGHDRVAIVSDEDTTGAGVDIVDLVASNRLHLYTVVGGASAANDPEARQPLLPAPLPPYKAIQRVAAIFKNKHFQLVIYRTDYPQWSAGLYGVKTPLDPRENGSEQCIYRDFKTWGGGM